MANQTDYNGCKIEVSSFQHTWGSYIGKWSGVTHIWYEGEHTPFGATVGESFGNSAEAEENALRVARKWIDEHPTRDFDR